MKADPPHWLIILQDVVGPPSRIYIHRGLCGTGHAPSQGPQHPIPRAHLRVGIVDVGALCEIPGTPTVFWGISSNSSVPFAPYPLKHVVPYYSQLSPLSLFFTFTSFCGRTKSAFAHDRPIAARGAGPDRPQPRVSKAVHLALRRRPRLSSRALPQRVLAHLEHGGDPRVPGEHRCGPPDVRDSTQVLLALGLLRLPGQRLDPPHLPAVFCRGPTLQDKGAHVASRQGERGLLRRLRPHWRRIHPRAVLVGS